MSDEGAGELFFDQLLTEQENSPDLEEESVNSNDSDLSDGASVFSTQSIDSADNHDIYGQPEGRAADEEPPDAPDDGAENRPENDAAAVIGAPAPPIPNISVPAPPVAENGQDCPADDVDGDDPSIPKERSVAHHTIAANKAVYVSFDIETGGEYCGIVQISAEIIRMELVQEGKSPRKDKAAHVQREHIFFNEYVNPGDGALWSEHCTNLHGLHANHPSIRGAAEMSVVWQQFYDWIHHNIKEDEVGILIAYNGEKCDLKWLWKLTQAPNSPYNMPERLKYFIDPYIAITKYDSCPLNPKKSKLDSLELGVVWKFITGVNLNNAHDSLVDVKAQTEVITDPSFVPYINRKQSVQKITDIFSRSKQNEWKKEMEPLRAVHEPWVEIDKDNNIQWEPGPADKYTGPKGGPPAGPSQYIIGVARLAQTLACIFLAMVPLTFWTKVAELSDKYAYKDWVVEKRATDRDGNPKKSTYLVDVPALTKGKKTPGRRHRADNEKNKYKFTPSIIIMWVAMLIFQGAHFGADKRTSRKMWRKPPHGLAIPYVRNYMTGSAYEFVRRNIHFADNAHRKAHGTPGYDPLFKVSFALDKMMKGIQLAWTVGRHVTIDESMIKYMGRAVSYVQYMPAKPIKHGIKVFCLCCGYTGIMLAFTIYVGKELTQEASALAKDGSALSICVDLIQKAGLTAARGRILYTDNWYTSMKLAIHMFEKYGWTIVGTIVPTDKKSRADLDIPFLKLSNGARQQIKRGWFREAVIELKTPTGKPYFIQCTTWKDKKQVCFLNSNKVGCSDGFSVKRSVKGKQTRDIIDGPRAQADYAKFFNAVDRNDRDSADYTTSIQTNRYYLRIFCWALDRVIHACYVVVCILAKQEIGPEEWNKYCNKNNGRHDFQIDLAIALANYAVTLGWEEGGARPDYMRTSDFVPCDCKKCYFCLHGYTNGVAHRKKREKVTVVYKCNKRLKSDKCTTERVNFGMKGGSYCRICMRKQDKQNNELNFDEKVKNCKSSTLGCAQCKEPICKACWKEGYDKHKS